MNRSCLWTNKLDWTDISKTPRNHINEKRVFKQRRWSAFSYPKRRLNRSNTHTHTQSMWTWETHVETAEQKQWFHRTTTYNNLKYECVLQKLVISAIKHWISHRVEPISEARAALRSRPQLLAPQPWANGAAVCNAKGSCADGPG